MTGRWAWAEVDLDAIAHNVRTIRQRVAPSAVWAVVKADAYGHGAVPVARAALAAGAEGLGVALTQEGVELRCAGIDAPIIVLSQQPPDDAPDLVRHRLVPTVYTPDGVEALDTAVAIAGAAPLPVHVKIDTGMHRAGASPRQAIEVVAAVERAAGLRLDGVFTHLAIADEPADPFTGQQLATFDEALASLPARAPGAPPVLVHAANSAGSLAHADARRALVRIGIAMYGVVARPGRRPPRHRPPPSDDAACQGEPRQAGRRGGPDLLRPDPHVRRRHDGGDRADRLRRRGAPTAFQPSARC